MEADAPPPPTAPKCSGVKKKALMKLKFHTANVFETSECLDRFIKKDYSMYPTNNLI